MESVLYQNRAQYYEAIENARKANDFGVFIEFALSTLFDSVLLQEKHQVKHEDKHQVELNDIALSILKALKNGNLSRKEIFAEIGMSGDSCAFKRHIEPLITEGLVERTIPDKPNSKLQKYRLTDKGVL